MNNLTILDLKLKISAKKQLYALYPLIVFTIVIIIGAFVINYRYFVLKWDEIRILIALYLIFFIPACILHIEYFFNDRNVILTIDKNNKQIIYQKGLEQILFSFNDIEVIEFYGETKSFNNLTTQNYYYYCFRINNREPLILTCFIIKDIEEVLFNVKINKNRRLFPSIMFESNLENNKDNES